MPPRRGTKDPAACTGEPPPRTRHAAWRLEQGEGLQVLVPLNIIAIRTASKDAEEFVYRLHDDPGRLHARGPGPPVVLRPGDLATGPGTPGPPGTYRPCRKSTKTQHCTCLHELASTRPRAELGMSIPRPHVGRSSKLDLPPQPRGAGRRRSLHHPKPHPPSMPSHREAGEFCTAECTATSFGCLFPEVPAEHKPRQSAQEPPPLSPPSCRLPAALVGGCQVGQQASCSLLVKSNCHTTAPLHQVKGDGITPPGFSKRGRQLPGIARWCRSRCREPARSCTAQIRKGGARPLVHPPTNGA